MRFTSYSPFYADMCKGGIEYAAEKPRATGFDAVEILSMNRDGEVIRTLSDARAARAVLDACGLPVSCYSLGANILARCREESFRFFGHHADMAAELGSPYFHHTVITELVWLEEFPPYDEAFAAVIDTVEAIAKYANSLGLTALYEPQGMYFNGVAGLSRLYSELKDRGCEVGICYDLGNPYFHDASPVEIGAHFAGEVKHIHVKDYLYLDAPVENRAGYVSKAGKHLYDAPVGAGAVDFSACFATLKNYTGDIAFEINGTDEELTDAVAYVKKSLLNKSC